MAKSKTDTSFELLGSIDEEANSEVEEFVDERDEALTIQYTLSSYGADYPVDAVVKRIQSGDIYVPTFQRGFIWPQSKASRFIESLLLGLPVPGIFLALEASTRKLLVVDGLQRLRTLQYFYEGVFEPTGRKFVLTGVSANFEEKSYKSLDEADRRRLEDSIIHATVVKQDHPEEDDSSIYLIFERLNTGGVLLNPQEIRACVYHGSFNELLRLLNNNETWRSVFGPVSARMRDQELILRFLALYYRFEQYRKPMKEFLNLYMSKNRNIEGAGKKELEDVFKKTIGVAWQALGDKAFRPAGPMNAAVFDAVMVGIAKRIALGPIANPALLKEEYDALLEDADFDELTSSKTTDEMTVSRRIKLAIAAFKDVE